MEKEEELDEVEQTLENEYKENWLKCYKELVIANLSSIYRYYGKTYYLSLENIMRISLDSFILTEKEKKNLIHEIKKDLNKNHNFKIISEEKRSLEFSEKEKSL